MSSRPLLALSLGLLALPASAQEPFRSYPERLPILPSGAFPVGGALVDLGGDGTPDLVVGTLGVSPPLLRSALLVYRNDGTGRLVEDSGARRNTLLPASQMIPGDFDGDGRQDVLLTISGELWRNDGNANLTSAGNVFPTTLGSNGHCAAGDFDGDGDLDLALPNQGSPNVLLFNDGTGRFSDASNRLTPDNQTTEVALAADVDGDQDLDLLFGSWPSSRPGQAPLGRVKLHLNDGSGQFTDVSSSRIPDVSVYALDLDAADFDGDGAVDLVVMNALGAPTLLVNDGRGSFVDRSGNLPAVGPTNGAQVGVLDFDLDGDRDLVLTAGFTQRVLINDGRARFTLLSPNLLPPATTATAGVLVGDLDLDGDDDVLLPRSALAGTDAAGLWYGQYRHVDASSEPRVGQDWELQIGHRAGAAPGFGAALPLISSRLGRTPLGPLGVLGIDPTDAIALDPVTLSGAAGHTSWTLRVPADPALAGAPVAVQALILQPLEVARFTNVWTARIGRD